MLNLHSLVLREAVIDHLPSSKSLARLFLQRLAHEKLVTYFLESLVFEMVTEVKELNDTVFKAHDYVSVEGHQTSLILLELNIVLTTLRRQIYIRYLCGTKWLYLIGHDVKPNELHFNFRIIGRLPYHNLAALMQRQENRGAKVLILILPLIVLQLNQIYKVTAYLSKVEQLLGSIPPFLFFCLLIYRLLLLSVLGYQQELVTDEDDE